ncbi:MAG: S41 family peptidase [Acidobacteriota bacterium]
MRSRRGFLIIVLVLACGAILGGQFFQITLQGSAPDDSASDPSITRFSQALKLIDDHYVDAPDKSRLTRNAVLGALHSLDPHSGFFDRREFSEMQDEQSSKFYGVGVTINQRNGRIYVLGTTRGMPGERAGLQYGDAIVAINGNSTRGWSQHDAQKVVRGDRGTAVELTVERLGSPEPLTLHVIRDEVPFPSVRNSYILRPGIGYIGLTGGFNQTTSEELRDALANLKVQGIKSLVLDLRRNPGGIFRQAVEVAEEFLPREVDIVTVASREAQSQKQVYRSENDEPQSMPLVVLINGETASASEIVAGAIQDRDRGLIVGEASFGKGLVQTVFRLPGGTGLTLTTGKYYTPSGRSIQRAYAGVSFYDYFYARYHTPVGQDTQRARSAETVYTPTGRRLSGGGGIEPDIAVRAQEENVPLRDACFEFVRRLVAGAIDGLEQYRVARLEHGHELRATDLPVNESVMQGFRSFLRERPDLRIAESQVSENIDYIRRRLRTEMITASYGTEVAEQFLMESDVQALRAIEALPQAKHLTDLAHLFAPPPTTH